MAKNVINKDGFITLGGGNLLTVTQKSKFENYVEFTNSTVLSGTVLSTTGDYTAKVGVPCTIISASLNARIGVSMPDRAGAPLPDGLIHRIFVDSIGTAQAASSQVVLSASNIAAHADAGVAPAGDMKITKPGEGFVLRWRKTASGSMPTSFSEYGYWSIMSSSI